MKTIFLGLSLVTLFCLPCSAQTAKDDTAGQTMATMVEPFSGKILFHQEAVGVFYEVTVTKGIVTGGLQHMRDSDTPISRIVGGWYIHDTGRLCLLIQLTEGEPGADWLSQCQQFHVDLENKQVTMDHTLHGYGLTTANSGVATAHVLDSIDGLVRLVGPK